MDRVEYRDGAATLEGLAVYDDAKSGPRPGVVVVHQWRGLGDYERKRAEMLAKLGYVAFCADIYGKGVRAPDRGGGEAGGAVQRVTGHCCGVGSERPSVS